MRISRFHPFGLPLPVYTPDGEGAAGAGAGAGGAGAGGGAAGGEGGAGAGAGAGAGGGAGEGGAGGGAGAGAGGAGEGAEKKPTQPNALGGTGTEDKPIVGDWPADWREKMATGADGKVDTKALERLKRMPAPGELWKSYTALDARLNGGKRDEPMPDPEKDPEGAKAWREARDVPAAADGYQLGDDLQKRLTDEDKPIMASFSEAMHKAGMPKGLYTAAAGWYLDLVESEAAETNQRDKKAADDVQEALRKEWGADYKANNTIAQRFATEVIPGVDWFTARLPDGRALGNIPEVVKAFAKLGMMEFGDAAFAGGEATVQTTTRMAELKKIMDTDIDTWNRSPDLRSEYFKLLEADNNRKQRTGKA